MTELDRGIALRPRDDGRYDAAIDPGWFVLTGPNGGYVAALLAQAVAAEVGDARPLRSLTVHYLAPAAAGPAEVEVVELRAGRSMTFAAVHLRQDGRLVATALAAAGNGRSDLAFQDVHPPTLPRPEDLPVPPDPGSVRPPIADRLDYRPAAPVALFSGAPAEFWCWLRLADPRPVDAAVLALYVDAMYPAIFLRATAPLVAPTVDLTVHLRAAPRPGYDGWCLARVATRTVADGYLEEDVDIYDDSGVLLAQGRQLGLVVPLG